MKRGRGFWHFLDDAVHALSLPSRLTKPICDRYEISLGIPREHLIEMDYSRQGKPTPWWLRR